MSITHITEEPDEKKFSRPVLEARQGGDSLSLASGFPVGNTLMKLNLVSSNLFDKPGILTLLFGCRTYAGRSPEQSRRSSDARYSPSMLDVSAPIRAWCLRRNC